MIAAKRPAFIPYCLASNPTMTIIITIPKVVFAVFTKNVGLS